MRLSALLGLSLVGLMSASAFADWPTHRGNAARTGHADNIPGPKSGKVLWVHKARDQFVASVVPGPKTLYVTGLGAFNTAALHALSLEPQAQQRVMWSKLPPSLKLPVVSSPALAEGKLVFGDGMHQTDGASLHCLAADTGMSLWRLSLPGQLVHIEGAPCIAKGRVYVGGGHAGVVCVDLNRVTLAGQEQTLAAAQAVIDKRWKELAVQYEIDKKKDPDFAIPPSDDALPKPAPKVLWQKGQGAWHVDAPLALTADSVLAASAYLDHEKSGERALVCLSADTGTLRWKTPLALNPWAGATIADNTAAGTAIVGGSSIRFDPKEIPSARGDVTAINLANGQVRWHVEVAGGVVSPIAVQTGLAVLTSTDGKVRALNVADGKPRWEHIGGAAFFAGPAIAGDVVYVADLNGIVQALSLADGRLLWKLDLAADPAIAASGMIYGSPVVQSGRLYLATCNLDGAQAAQNTAVICIGEK